MVNYEFGLHDYRSMCMLKLNLVLDQSYRICLEHAYRLRFLI